ncbi:alpha/beta fold hydrolase [Auraticoccus monumenti]|uniref:Pimeloyl-ACP methyl ester carboxylesterase n=1 Tax=Auraticoccus monumenti TaxID=675864 RepID=A0A1G6TR32_9ACTN|nr:alpha/beta hydrolase [Auraticoccus monumenti]SDD31622.1 Pimeloyl-ACP methyl ester carboxylesterase [Auraticoccus monumenti]
MTPSVLLLSGAGLPTWVWDRTREGLPVPSTVAPRPTSRSADVAAHARVALAAAPEGPLVVVAHSAGGVVAAELSGLAPDRVRGVLAVAAVVPAAGGSYASSLPRPLRLVLPALLRVAGTRPPEKALRTSLAAGVDEATAQRLVEDFAPESRRYFTSRVSTPLQAPVLGYVTTADDRQLPLAWQHRYLRRLEPGFTRHLPGGHLPMLEHPDRLREAVTAFLDLVAEGGP